MRYLLERGADLSLNERLNTPPLLIAADNGHLEVMMMLKIVD